MKETKLDMGFWDPLPYQNSGPYINWC